MSPLSIRERLGQVAQAFAGIGNLPEYLEDAPEDCLYISLDAEEVEQIGRRITELQEIVRQNALVAPTESENQ